MKKIRSLSLVLIMALLVGMTAMFMVGCDNTISVNFTIYNEDGSEVMESDSKAFEKNKVFSHAVSKENYDFDGWYLDKEYINKFDMENTKLTEHLELYGRYVLKEYTVTFIVDGGEAATQKVKHGQKATEPVLEKFGHEIIYWYRKEDCTDSFSLSYNEIIENKILYATWSKVDIYFKCSIDDDNAVWHVRSLKYGDSIKECADIVEKKYTESYSDGWFLDKEHTKPIDVNTYKISVNDKFYWRTRTNMVLELGLEKLSDGTFAITNEPQSNSSKLLDKRTKIMNIPDSFLDREGNKQIITTIKTEAFKGELFQIAIMFGKNIVNVEENAFGYGYSPSYQNTPFAVFFENDSSEMNLADNIVHPKTQAVGGVAVYYGEKYLINEEYIYQNTGNDIVILKCLGWKETVIIPKTIDGVPVTKINSSAIGAMLYQTTCFIQDNIKIIMSGAFRNTDIHCIFAESEASGFSKDWQGYGSKILYNATIPSEPLG